MRAILFLLSLLLTCINSSVSLFASTLLTLYSVACSPLYRALINPFSTRMKRICLSFMWNSLSLDGKVKKVFDVRMLWLYVEHWEIRATLWVVEDVEDEIVENWERMREKRARATWKCKRCRGIHEISWYNECSQSILQPRVQFICDRVRKSTHFCGLSSGIEYWYLD